jgi:hypothetical protein
MRGGAPFRTRTRATRIRLAWVTLMSAALWGVPLAFMHGTFDGDIPLSDPLLPLSTRQRIWPFLTLAVLAVAAVAATFVERRFAKHHLASDRATMIAIVAGLLLAFAVFQAGAKIAF